MSNEEFDERELVHLKIAGFKEFFKRIYFESKYVNLCTLNEDYLTEVLINLKNISVTQKNNLLDIKELAKDEEITHRNRGLETVVEETEDDYGDLDIASKIAAIQDQLSAIEHYEEEIMNGCITAIKDAQFSVKYLRVENEELKQRVEYYRAKEVQPATRDFYIQTDPPYIEVENVYTQVNMDREKQVQVDEDYRKDQERFVEVERNFFDLSEKFSKLQEMLEKTNRALEYSEKEKKDLIVRRNEHSEETATFKSEIKRLQERITECEEKLLKSERQVRDREQRIEDVRGEAGKREGMISDLRREIQTQESQKATLEARLKTANNIMKNHEKERDRMNITIQKREQHIASLQKQVEHFEAEIDNERDIHQRQIESVGSSMQELTELIKIKDGQIDELRDNNTDVLNECQRMAGSIHEKDQEIMELQTKLSDNKRKFDTTVKNFEIECERKMEDNFTSVVAYLEEKEAEIVRLKRELEDSNSQSMFITHTESKKAKDLEDLLVHMTKELRLKEEEIIELNALLHNFRQLGGELSYFRETMEQMQ